MQITANPLIYLLIIVLLSASIYAERGQSNAPTGRNKDDGSKDGSSDNKDAVQRQSKSSKRKGSGRNGDERIYTVQDADGMSITLDLSSLIGKELNGTLAVGDFQFSILDNGTPFLHTPSITMDTTSIYTPQISTVVSLMKAM